jgi:hypothetical protein
MAWLSCVLSPKLSNSLSLSFRAVSGSTMQLFDKNSQLTEPIYDQMPTRFTYTRVPSCTVILSKVASSSRRV